VSLVVSLDVLPADVPAEYAPAMVAACSDALSTGRCAMATTLPESMQPDAVALVIWQDSGFLSVTVRVGRGGAQWTARSLSFSERDSISERWTTVGLTVATLVGETRALDVDTRDPLGAAAAAKPPPTPTPTQEPAPRMVPRPVVVAAPVAPPKVTPVSAPDHRWETGAGFLAGPAWDNGGWQRGAWLSLGFRPRGTPFLLQGMASYALSDGPRVAAGELSTRYATFGLGAGVVGAWDALDVAGAALLEVALRRVDAEWRGRAASDHDFPVRVRTLASFPAHGSVAAVAGVALRLPPANSKENEGLMVRDAPISAEAVLGLRVRL
jgi:hypothetical protein